MVIFGVVAQWIAWRLKLPSILFLLIFGFIAGPVSGFVVPDALFGDVLPALVSISVAVILFEGGLTLRFSELREITRVLRNLITVGLLVTWIAISALAFYLLNLNLTLSILLGAILVVTGPTVVGPLLRHIRPVGRVGNIVKWEGILNDPLGALLAVLVFEIVLVGEFSQAGTVLLFIVLKTLLFGGVVAVLGAMVLAALFRRYWIPDYLHEAAALMTVVAVFALSNHFQEESGLLAVTIMGIVLANQKKINIRHIVEFKENLRVLIISSLFILLAARLQFSDIELLDFQSLIFLVAIILVVRPLAVALSFWGSDLNWKERVFVAFMAPRGIVAAAISAVFALRLAEEGVSQTEYLVPLIFMVIIGTVGFYGLASPALARWLQLAEARAQGVVLVGAHSWARAMAKALQDEGFRVLLVDSNRHNEFTARMAGLDTYYGSVLAGHIFDDIDLRGTSRLLALTSNDEANSLAALHFAEIFGRSEVYQLAPEVLEDEIDAHFSPKHLRGRFLFSQDANYQFLSQMFNEGAVVKSTTLTEDFGYSAFQKMYNGSVLPLFIVTARRELEVFTANESKEPRPGQTLISLVSEQPEIEKRNQDSQVSRGV